MASATSDVAAGHLDASSSDKVDVNWLFTAPDMVLTHAGTTHTVTTVSSAVAGNWATLMPFDEPLIEKVGVSYHWVGPDRPTDVTPPAGETVNKGTAYTAAQQEATAQEYIFEGWYTDEACKQKYADGTALNADTMLYGKWTKAGGTADPGNPADIEDPETPADNTSETGSATGNTDTNTSSSTTTDTKTASAASPGTGDDTSLWMWITAAGAAALVAVRVLVARHKAKEE